MEEGNEHGSFEKEEDGFKHDNEPNNSEKSVEMNENNENEETEGEDKEMKNEE